VTPSHLYGNRVKLRDSNSRPLCDFIRQLKTARWDFTVQSGGRLGVIEWTNISLDMSATHVKESANLHLLSKSTHTSINEILVRERNSATRITHLEQRNIEQAVTIRHLTERVEALSQLLLPMYKQPRNPTHTLPRHALAQTPAHIRPQIMQNMVAGFDTSNVVTISGERLIVQLAVEGRAHYVRQHINHHGTLAPSVARAIFKELALNIRKIPNRIEVWRATLCDPPEPTNQDERDLFTILRNMKPIST
jgi:hypothetical protein